MERYDQMTQTLSYKRNAYVGVIVYAYNPNTLEMRQIQGQPGI